MLIEDNDALFVAHDVVAVQAIAELVEIIGSSLFSVG
jgi:hypothetical protein